MKKISLSNLKKLLCVIAISFTASSAWSQTNFNQFSDKHIAILNPNAFNTCTLTVAAGETLKVTVNFGGSYENLLRLYAPDGHQAALMNNQYPEQNFGFNGNTISFTNSTSGDAVYKLVFENKSGKRGDYRHEKNPWMAEPIKVTDSRNPYVIGARENGLDNYTSTIVQASFQ